MAIYTAYYDASSTEIDQDRPLVVAGLLSTADRWKRFESAWAAVLRRHDLPYIHMKEFAGSHPPFERLAGRERERATILRRLVAVLKRHVVRAFVFRVLPAEFHEVNERYVLASEAHPSPYPFAAVYCTGLAEQWLKERHATDDVLHVFEKGDRGQGALIRLMEQGVNQIAVRPKEDPTTGAFFAPFQGSDLVAYEHRLEIERRLTTVRSRPAREPLKALQRDIPTDAKYFKLRDLYAFCRAHPEHFPRRSA
jgi:hypothetical protein